MAEIINQMIETLNLIIFRINTKYNKKKNKIAQII